MPGIVGAGHLALTVRDVARSSQWYEALFEWPVVRRSAAGESEAPVVTLYDPRSSFALSLRQTTDRAADRFDCSRTGLDHVAFRAADEAELDEWATRLDGLQIERSPVCNASDAVKFVSFEDPDGIRLEFYAHQS